MNTLLLRNASHVYLVQFANSASGVACSQSEVERLRWLLSADVVEQSTMPGAVLQGAVLQGPVLQGSVLQGSFLGPRREMVTPWSTNAVDISHSLGVQLVVRMEEFVQLSGPTIENGFVTRRDGQRLTFDPMLMELYASLGEDSLEVNREREPLKSIHDLRAFNQAHALALSEDELVYLEEQQKLLDRPFTDAEIHGFSQINSEHCRHKIFNGEFILDGVTQPKSLFGLIKDTSKVTPKQLVSAYKDNVAFVRGPEINWFSPERGNGPSSFRMTKESTVLSLKAETHNFPTTVEPFYGASTGSGGEIRDRMAGGQGSIPLAGTAVYMTSYPRLGVPGQELRDSKTKPRKWKYQTPAEILIKASIGASDFGNKFGQPLINGSVLTFESNTSRGMYAFDRTVMMAGGVGYAKEAHAQKRDARVGDVLVLLGGDNYRIGMAGGSVSSVDTGQYGREVELSAVQRANPEMQKRVYNVVRALVEMDENPVLLIHDHGAGGHLNCFTELLEVHGGRIDLGALPVGDRTLSQKEILSNESQERMGLIVAPESVALIKEIAAREQAPCFIVGEVTGDGKIVCLDVDGSKPVDLPLSVLLGSSPKTVIRDLTQAVIEPECPAVHYAPKELREVLDRILTHESVACKDWLTNKVDRSVTGLVARQQEVGPLHLPLANCGVMALDYTGTVGTATAVGHAPVVGMVNERAGAILSVAESLTNLVWAPLCEGLDSVVLSANWMWPGKQSGEDIRLYHAVEALSTFCQELRIAVPTGKDSLSMTMKYEDGTSVRAPGTVVVSAVGSCSDVRRVVTPELKPVENSSLLWVDLSGISAFPLGGSVLSQDLGSLGGETPTVASAEKFRAGFDLLQTLIFEDAILAGHDISDGGLIVAAAEMAFVGDIGLELQLPEALAECTSRLFCQKPGVLIQVQKGKERAIRTRFTEAGLSSAIIGTVRVGQPAPQLSLIAPNFEFVASLQELRSTWFEPSAALDALQTKPEFARERQKLVAQRQLRYDFPPSFTGRASDLGLDLLGKKKSGLKAAVIREKGTNGDRELAYCLFTAGFDVVDIAMPDLVSGAASLADIQFAAFPGGFANSDVLGAGRGWAGVFRYHSKARMELEHFFARPDTLSIGVCNGCQLVSHFDVFQGPDASPDKPRVQLKHNASGRFESSFVTVEVASSPSVLLHDLVGTKLGIWVAHGEGRFVFDEAQSRSVHIPLTYTSSHYPMNPNGSDFQAAAMCSHDGRHLAIMPHLERSFFPWQWAYYPGDTRLEHEVSPWATAFASARNWLLARK